MPIRCLDCGSQHSKASAEGRCIACDSYNLHRVTNSEITKNPRERAPKTLIEIVIMALVWGLLIFGIWDRYIK
jgi:predicted ATP-dependent serine protease